MLLRRRFFDFFEGCFALLLGLGLGLVFRAAATAVLGWEGREVTQCGCAVFSIWGLCSEGWKGDIGGFWAGRSAAGTGDGGGVALVKRML